MSLRSFKKSERSKAASKYRGSERLERISDVLNRLTEVEGLQRSLRSDMETFKEQYESSWELIRQNKQAVESMVTEFNIQSGFVGVKQYQYDWGLRKKEWMADVQKIMNEKIAA